MSREITEKARKVLGDAAGILEERGMAKGSYYDEHNRVYMIGAIRIAGHGDYCRAMQDSEAELVEWRAIGLVREYLEGVADYSVAEYNDRIWPDIKKAAAALRGGAKAHWPGEPEPFVILEGDV